jgi:hypothetical protein
MDLKKNFFAKFIFSCQNFGILEKGNLSEQKNLAGKKQLSKKVF